MATEQMLIIVTVRRKDKPFLNADWEDLIKRKRLKKKKKRIHLRRDKGQSKEPPGTSRGHMSLKFISQTLNFLYQFGDKVISSKKSPNYSFSHVYTSVNSSTFIYLPKLESLICSPQPRLQGYQVGLY